MLGLIMETARSVVSEKYGADTWDALLEAAEVDGAYTRLGDYPSAELGRLVEAAAAKLKMSADDVWCLVGEEGFPALLRHVPPRLQHFEDSRTLFRELEGTIHANVSAVHQHATPPRFGLTEDGDTITLEYQSRRGLCHLAQGLAIGATRHFGETASVEQIACGRASGSPCMIQIQYSP